MWNQWEAISKQINKAVKDTGLNQQLNDVRKKATERINKIASQVVSVDKQEESGEQQQNEQENSVLFRELEDQQALPLSQQQGVGNDGAGEGWEQDLDDINLNDESDVIGFAQEKSYMSSGVRVTSQNTQNNGTLNLVQENAQLKKRLKAVEEAAADAFGENEELRERLQQYDNKFAKAEEQSSAYQQELHLRDEQLRTLQKSFQELESKQIQQAEQEGHYLSLLNKLQRQSRSLLDQQQEIGQSTSQLSALQEAVQRLDNLSQNPQFSTPPKHTLTSTPQQPELPPQLTQLLSDFQTSLNQIQHLQQSIGYIEQLLGPVDLMSKFDVKKIVASDENSLRQQLEEAVYQVEQDRDKSIGELKMQHDKAMSELLVEQQNMTKSLKQKNEEVQQQLQSLRQEYNSSVESFKIQVTQKDKECLKLQEGLKAKVQELDMLREGAKAEAHLAATNIREAQKRVEQTEEEKALLRTQITELLNTQNLNQDLQNQLQLLHTELESKTKRVSSLEAQIKTFTETLASERDVAQQEAKQAQEQFERSLEEAASKAREAGRQEGMMAVSGDAKKKFEEMEVLLKGKEDEINCLQGRVQILEQVEKQHQDLVQTHTTLVQQHTSLQVEHEALIQNHEQQLQQSSSFSSELESLRTQITERSKRFTMLQKGFDSQQQQLRDENQNLIDSIQDRDMQLQKLGQDVEQLKELLLEKNRLVEELEVSLRKKGEEIQGLTRSLDEVRGVVGDKDGRIFQLENEVSEVKERLENVGASTASKDEIQRVIDEAVATQVLKAQQETKEMMEKLHMVERRVASAESERDMAENAKIELALQLARLDQQRNIETTLSSRSQSEDELLRRAEEAEMALSVYRSRATKAEEEVSEKSLKMLELEQQVEQLTWQIKMVASGEANPNSSSSSAVAWLDVLGCGANFKRR